MVVTMDNGDTTMNTNLTGKDLAPRPIAELIKAPEEGRADWTGEGRRKPRTSNRALRAKIFGRRGQ